MALRGTLKDFGIADIFQLIGHQAKSGKLAVKNRSQVVNIYFREGNIVRAEPGSRERKDLLGAMLVRSEVVSEVQLQAALEKQKSTLKRLGQILVEDGVVDKDTLQIFTRLQTTEAIYRLFLWDSGTYEFEASEVPPPADRSELLRSENVLMEGFRQNDEWPSIRRKITGYGLVFYKVEDLEALVAQESQGAAPSDDDPFGDLDAAFADLGGSGGSGRLRNIGDNERLVYALITPERDVQKIIDLSRLGEFDTCKALCNLIDAGIVAPLPEGERRKPSAQATVGGITSGRRSWIMQGLQAVAVVGVMVLAYSAVQRLDLDASSLWSLRAPPQGHLPADLQEILSQGQLLRLREALAVFEAQHGDYPPSLQDLVDAGLARPEDLTFPWRSPYHYRARRDGYELLRPLY